MEIPISNNYNSINTALERASIWPTLIVYSLKIQKIAALERKALPKAGKAQQREICFKLPLPSWVLYGS
jgi:hypothetical protein